MRGARLCLCVAMLAVLGGAAGQPAGAGGSYNPRDIVGTWAATWNDMRWVVKVRQTGSLSFEGRLAKPITLAGCRYPAGFPLWTDIRAYGSFYAGHHETIETPACNWRYTTLHHVEWRIVGRALWFRCPMSVLSSAGQELATLRFTKT